ncbi:MAG: carbohydrate binding family 9 domain-containing protein, partial [Gemmatimonadota bacterium]|nr:carbohydrate binding family 9 domain-containing protein [Gemmatimonadota bacterium]
MIGLLVLGLQLVAAPDTARDAHANGIPVPRVTAVRVARAPVIDGKLEDEAWRQAPVVTGFTQSRPTEGAPAQQQTEVQVLYDESALYIGARMRESDRSRIFEQLARRDQGDNGDLLIVAIDSYHDHLTAFGFALNPSGVKIDATSSRDEENWDISWDAVWTGATHIGVDGWTAEMRIPLSQLRFPPGGAHVWGINFWRIRKLANENSALVVVKQSERGFASRFAHLVGIAGLRAPRRFEVMPYVRAQAETRRALAGDPFFAGRRASSGAGVDVKYGVTSNLTLDATVNPDFGQVEADPAQLNLTAFEPFFQERRPFFVEGAQIFDFGVSCNAWCFVGPPSLFYSRRIGRSPSLGARDPYETLAAHESRDSLLFMDVPQRSTILGAAKLTGQLASGTSIGILHAETGRADARVDATIRRTDRAPLERVRYEDPVEPHTHYSVLRLRQSFNGGATTVGALGTSVARQMPNDRVRAALPSQAFTAGVDARHRWSKNRFDLAAAAAV